MLPLAHGYTNHTVGDATEVVKSYRGPDADLRQSREQAVLRALHGRLPVPGIRASAPGSLTLSFLPGAHGQDLIEAGHAAAVLRACGRLLRTLHALDVAAFAEAQPPAVLVHGDFGPNNILLDPAAFTVTGLLDWEFAHVGAPIEDLAWCEWIVRAHHPTRHAALAEFFAGYAAPVPRWPERQATMIARCLELREFCRRWDPRGPAVRTWTERAEAVERWVE